MGFFKSKNRLLIKIEELEDKLEFYKKLCDHLKQDTIRLYDKYDNLLKLIPDNGRDPNWPIDLKEEWSEKLLSEISHERGIC